MGILNKLTKKQLADREEAQEKKEVKEVRQIQPAKEVTGDAHRVLLHPLISEKGSHLEAAGKYTFLVNSKATKVDVRRAVEQMYGIRPVKVNMVVSEGKNVRFGRFLGKQSQEKKAIITLPEGKKIEIHEGV